MMWMEGSIAGTAVPSVLMEDIINGMLFDCCSLEEL